MELEEEDVAVRVLGFGEHAPKICERPLWQRLSPTRHKRQKLHSGTYIQREQDGAYQRVLAEATSSRRQIKNLQRGPIVRQIVKDWEKARHVSQVKQCLMDELVERYKQQPKDKKHIHARTRRAAMDFGKEVRNVYKRLKVIDSRIKLNSIKRKFRQPNVEVVEQQEQQDVDAEEEEQVLLGELLEDLQGPQELRQLTEMHTQLLQLQDLVDEPEDHAELQSLLSEVQSEVQKEMQVVSGGAAEQGAEQGGGGAGQVVEDDMEEHKQALEQEKQALQLQLQEVEFNLQEIQAAILRRSEQTGDMGTCAEDQDQSQKRKTGDRKTGDMETGRAEDQDQAQQEGSKMKTGDMETGRAQCAELQQEGSKRKTKETEKAAGSRGVKGKKKVEVYATTKLDASLAKLVKEKEELNTCIRLATEVATNFNPKLAAYPRLIAMYLDTNLAVHAKVGDSRVLEKYFCREDYDTLVYMLGGA